MTRMIRREGSEATLSDNDLAEVQDQLRAASYDFAREAETIFHHKDWTWAGEGVPSADSIQRTINVLVSQLQPGKAHFDVESGRIQVYYLVYGSHIKCGITLSDIQGWPSSRGSVISPRDHYYKETRCTTRAS